MNEFFTSFTDFLKDKFPGQKVYKIPINAGFSCPNKDGLISKDGCVFCDRYGSGPVHTSSLSIEKQIEFYINKHPRGKYIAYFQSHCNTYAPITELKQKYGIVFKYKDIVGLFIGTRPDMISDPVYSLFEEISQRIFLMVELGLQSIHEQSLLLLNRNHTYSQFHKTFYELKAKKIDTVIHLIIGIPGETKVHMRETIMEMNVLKPAGIKFHLLHILKDTDLSSRYAVSPFPLLSQEEYTDIIIDLLEHLDPDIVVHRLTAEREKDIFIAPVWALNKQAVLSSIKGEMKKRGSFQGKFIGSFEFSHEISNSVTPLPD